jgi:hypothetical protein
MAPPTIVGMVRSFYWDLVGLGLLVIGGLIEAIAQSVQSSRATTLGIVLIFGGLLFVVLNEMHAFRAISDDRSLVWSFPAGFLVVGALIASLAKSRSNKIWGIAIVMGGLLGLVLLVLHDFRAMVMSQRR